MPAADNRGTLHSRIQRNVSESGSSYSQRWKLMPLQEEDAGRFSQSLLQPNSNPSFLTARGKWKHEEHKVIYI